MGTAKVYIASNEVLAGIGNREHLYLIYDPDTDNDGDASTGTGVEIIRGGPTGAGIGQIIVEVGVSRDSSADDFDVGETMADRNFTQLQTGGAATTLWSSMKTSAQSLGTYNGGTQKSTMIVDYYALGTN